MIDFWAANEPFISAALIIGLGYFLKRVRLLRAADGEVLARIALNVTLPAVVLLNVPKATLAGSNGLLPLFPPVASVLTLAIGFLVFRCQGRTDRGLSLTASVGYNIGLFAVPLVTALYGPEGVARYALADIGNVFAIFGIGYHMAYRFSPHRQEGRLGLLGMLKLILGNVPFLAYLTGLVMIVLHVQLPGFVARVLAVPAAMNRGVALLVLGVLLRFRFPPGTWKAILPPLLLRYLFGIVGSALVIFLVPLPLDLRIAVAGVLIMPAGLTLIPFAAKWGYDRDRAAAILNTGIPVSFVLFWAVWAVGEFVAS